MDAVRFDALTRLLDRARTRRALAPLPGGLLAGLALGADPAAARKKKKKKKATLCLDGQTVTASKKKKKQLLKRGATAGACPASPPPPPPPGCTPQCSGTTCGGDDGCGGVCGCPAGFLCHGGICQACDVACPSADHVCDGTALQTTLAAGGTVYVCPGRYTGTYLPGTVTVIGAGDGDDPATSTILDANGSDRVMRIAAGVTANLHGLRLTGGSVAGNGGGVQNSGTLTMTDCIITGNEAGDAGGGIITSGPLTLTRCQVTGNRASHGGGISVFSGTTTLVRSIVGQNDTTGIGGGIWVFIGATLRVHDGSQITGNKANEGGGLFSEATTVFADGSSSVTGNTAANGGGIYKFGGSVTLNGAPVTGNDPNNCAPAGSVDGCIG